MKLLNLASNQSFWRGVNYHHENRIISSKKIDEGCYQGKIRGSNDAIYDVTINIVHPKNQHVTVHLLKGVELSVSIWSPFIWGYFQRKNSRCWIT